MRRNQTGSSLHRGIFAASARVSKSEVRPSWPVLREAVHHAGDAVLQILKTEVEHQPKLELGKNQVGAELFRVNVFASRFPEPVLVTSSVGRKSSVVKSGIEVNALADPGLIR